MSGVEFENIEKKREICIGCKKTKNALRKEFRFHFIELDKYIKKNFLIPKNLLKEINTSSFFDFQYEKMPLGKFALYEFWLTYKLLKKEIPKQNLPEAMALLKNCILICSSMKEILSEIKPDRIVMYNSLYSVNRVVTYLADQQNIPHFTIHAGPNFSRMYSQLTIFKGLQAQVEINRHPFLRRFQENPASSSQLKKVFEHANQFLLAQSPWVYSKKSSNILSREIKERIGIKNHRHVLLAVSRSNDERLAAKLSGLNVFKKQPLFQDQAIWIDWLIEYAEKNPETFIIYRVHPREFPNKRESVISENATDLLKMIKNKKTPENFMFNLPSQNISLHDLLKIIDLTLNNSSTVGLEASLFGIPVLGIGDDLFSFDPALQIEPRDLTEYARLIEILASGEWKLERVRMACRWLNYLNNEVCIDIEDSYRQQNQSAKPSSGTFRRWIPRIFRKHQFEEVRHRPAEGPREIEKLTYAVLNNKDSHIGEFPVEFGDFATETDLIKKDLWHRAQSVSHPEDKTFFEKIKKVLSQN